MSGTLPRWLERLFGIPQAGSGEGTAWTLDDAWGWPAWMTLLLVAGAAVWILACYLRETGPAGRLLRLCLASIRLALAAIVLFMIASFVLSLNRTGLPYVVIIVDDSASMGTADKYDDKELAALVQKRLKAAGYERGTRLNLAKSLLLADRGALLRSIQRRYKLKVYLVSTSARNLPGKVEDLLPELEKLEATGETSRLGQGLEEVLDDLRGTPPSAVVLLSDGINTEGETLADAAEQARRKGVPLFVVALGSESPARDLELTDLLVDDVVFVNDIVNFEFKLTGAGFEGRKVKAVLRTKDQRKPLAEQQVTIGPDGESQRVRLPYRPPEVGEFDYIVEIENLPEELQSDNNRQQRHVSVRKEQIKVLLVQSYPSYEFRYLKHLLERDATIQLKTVLQESDLDYAEQDQSALRVFPVRREELLQYDVLLFGDVDPAFLSALGAAAHQRFRGGEGGRRRIPRRPPAHAAGLSQLAAGHVAADRLQRRRRHCRAGRRTKPSRCSRPKRDLPLLRCSSGIPWRKPLRSGTSCPPCTGSSRRPRSSRGARLGQAPGAAGARRPAVAAHRHALRRFGQSHLPRDR